MKARFLLPLLVLAVTAGCARNNASTSTAGSSVPNGDLVLAKVGKSEITGNELDHKLKVSNQKLYTEYKNAHNWRIVLDTMIEQKMIAWEAEKKGLDKTAEFKRRMELARTEILNALYVDEVNAEATPKDEELRKQYNDAIEGFRVKESARVAQIVVKTRPEADQVRKDLLGGANWDALCQAKSIDDLSKRQNGLLGWINATDPVYGKTMPELFHAAMATDDGGYTQPVETVLGWHILHVFEKQKAGVKSFEEVAPMLRGKAVNVKAHEIYAQRMQELRQKYNVSVNEDKFQEFMTGPLDEKKLFDMAQQSRDPREKIGYYQRIVSDYPKSEYADKAQFMVGFTYSEELKDYALAEKAFKAVMANYPKSELSESARWMLENMRNPDIPHLPGGMKPGGPTAAKGS